MGAGAALPMVAILPDEPRADKIVRLADQLHHEVCNEPGFERVLAAVVPWLAAHVLLVVLGASQSCTTDFNPARVATGCVFEVPYEHLNHQE